MFCILPAPCLYRLSRWIWCKSFPSHYLLEGEEADRQRQDELRFRWVKPPFAKAGAGTVTTRSHDGGDRSQNIQPQGDVAPDSHSMWVSGGNPRASAPTQSSRSAPRPGRRRGCAPPRPEADRPNSSSSAISRNTLARISNDRLRAS